jgi:hypothetical protein
MMLYSVPLTEVVVAILLTTVLGSSSSPIILECLYWEKSAALVTIELEAFN